MTDDDRTGGLRRTATPTPGARLAEAGWRVARLDGADTPAEFHRRIAAVLSFPAHYGANLDALWDCLADLDRPTAILWSGWGALADGHPDFWDRLTDLLGDRADQQPAVLVLLQPDPSGSVGPDA